MNGVPMTVFWNSYTITAATEDAVLELSLIHILAGMMIGQEVTKMEVLRAA